MPENVTPIVAFLAWLMAPSAWLDLYHNGRFSPDTEPNMLVLLIVRGVVIVLVFVTTRVLRRLIARAVYRATAAASAVNASAARRLATLETVVTSSASYLLGFSAFIVSLFVVGLTWKALAPLLGAASVLGLAVGFGAQRLVRDVISGLFLLGEGQFDVGDRVTIGAVTGAVVETGLRITRIRDDDGRLCVIANGDIAQVYNASRGVIRISAEVAVPRDALASALDALHIAARTARADLPGTPDDAAPVMHVTALAADKVTVRISLFVVTSERETAEDALRRRILEQAESGALQLA